MKDALRRSYDRDAPTYDDTFRGLQLPKYRLLLGPEGALVSSALERGRILDLGCGTGLLARFLAESGRDTSRLVGLDLSHGMLAVARERGHRVVQGDAVRLPFGPASFEAVLAFTVLRILPGTDRPTVREVARVLRPGGIFCVSVLEENHDESFPDQLEEAGFVVEGPRPCEQDVGYVCVKGDGKATPPPPRPS